MFYNHNTSYSLRASDGFIQPIFLRRFRCLSTCRKSKGCNLHWSAPTCLVEQPCGTWAKSLNLGSIYLISYMAKIKLWCSVNQYHSIESKTDQKFGDQNMVRPPFLSPNLQVIYPIRYMGSFCVAIPYL